MLFSTGFSKKTKTISIVCSYVRLFNNCELFLFLNLSALRSNLRSVEKSRSKKYKTFNNILFYYIFVRVLFCTLSNRNENKVWGDWGMIS